MAPNSLTAPISSRISPTEIDLKVPPYSLEAEAAVLGSILLEKEALERALELLGEGSFFDENHRKIFLVIKEMSLANKVVDIVTLGDELRRQEFFSAIGGSEYLTQIMSAVPTSAHIEDYVRIVKDKETLRSLIHAAAQVVGS